jgi:hypothetical protein
MSVESDDRGLLQAYLLGTLPEEERARLGEWALTDGEFFDRLREAEDDLIDALARGELNAQEAEATRRFLSDTGQEDRLRVARAWQARTARVSSARPFRPGSGRMLLAIAATLVVLLAAGWLFRGSRSGPAQPAAVPGSSGPVFSILLPAGVARSRRDMPAISIPPGTAFVRMELETPAMSGASNWRAVLRDAAGAAIATESRPIGGWARNAELLAPARALKSGEYEIELASSSDGQTWRVQAYYYLTVR